MENATHRLRKARRQGLSGRDVGAGSRVPRGSTRLADVSGEPRANRSRKTKTTHRKAKRASASPGRRRT